NATSAAIVTAGVIPGVSAASTKRWSALRTADQVVERPQITRVGRRRKYRKPVKDSLSAVKPEPTRGSSAGLSAAMRRAIPTSRATLIKVRLDNRRCAIAGPPDSRSLTKTGIKALFNEPAMTAIAKKGSMKAIMNASTASDVPNILATVRSFATVTTFARTVDAPMITAAPRIPRFADAAVHRFHSV